LAFVERHLSRDGTAIVFAPGRDLVSSPGRAESCLSSSELEEHCRRRFAGSEVSVETFGNPATAAAVAAGLDPIVCMGETLAQRDASQTLSVVGTQLEAAVLELGEAELLRTVIAYEPVWAIGTGRNATPAQAQEVHAFIRQRLGARAKGLRILYGGSVKPDNVAGLLAQEDIDGALVGGASLTVDSFATIVKEGTRACTPS